MRRFRNFMFLFSNIFRFPQIGGWGESNLEIVSFRLCVRTRGLVA